MPHDHQDQAYNQDSGLRPDRDPTTLVVSWFDALELLKHLRSQREVDTGKSDSGVPENLDGGGQHRIYEIYTIDIPDCMCRGPDSSQGYETDMRKCQRLGQKTKLTS